MSPSPPSARSDRMWACLLAVVTFTVYAPSLSNEFLNYDDPWLIEQNRILHEHSLSALHAIWLDLSRVTRLTLGAEYLPLRDTSLWLEGLLYGLNALPLRVTNLLLYIAACLLLRQALKKILPWQFAELCSFLFAVHPIHVESVAWLAGRKDVLALLFSMGALNAYLSPRRERWVPVWVLGAMLAKSAAVILPLFLPIFDLMLARKPRTQPLLLTAVITAAAMALHLFVGSQVGMIQEPLGGSRGSTLISMGTVWLRYAWGMLAPTSLSVVQLVTVKANWDWPAVAGYLALFGFLALGVWLYLRQRKPLVLVSALCFLIPLLPVSQVLAPLQNAMADRYAVLAVLSYCLLAAALGNLCLEKWRGRGALFALVSVGFYSVATFLYSARFAHSEALFRHAVQQAPNSAIAHYQLGKALEAADDLAGAQAAFEHALNGVPAGSPSHRRATNNLARLYGLQGRWSEAEALLQRGRALWPGDPKMLGNLIKVLYRQGKEQEARAVFDELQRLPATETLDLANTPEPR